MPLFGGVLDIAWTYHILFILPPIDGCLSWLQVGAITKKTVLNVYVHVSLWIVFLFLMVEVAGVELLDDVENVNLTL